MAVSVHGMRDERRRVACRKNSMRIALGFNESAVDVARVLRTLAQCHSTVRVVLPNFRWISLGLNALPEKFSRSGRSGKGHLPTDLTCRV